MEWIVLLHVMAGATWFGGQVYVEGLMAAVARTKDSNAIVTASLNIVKTSVRVFSGATVLLLITGTWVIVGEGTAAGFETMFVSIGFLIVIIGLGITLFYFRPKGAALEEVVAKQGPESDDALAIAKQVSMVSHIMTLLVTIALVVMVLHVGL